MKEIDSRWLYIWAAERKHGKSIPDSNTDEILQFVYLDDIIKEKPFTYQSGCYKPKTIRVASSPSIGSDTSITVVIKGFIEDPHNTHNLHIMRHIYLRLESKEAKNVGAWQYCIASFFSFLFSCRIHSGMSFHMQDEWKGTEIAYPPFRRTGTPKEIERLSEDYADHYEMIMPSISDTILSWSNYYFSHRAKSWGIHKYLHTVNHDNQMTVDQKIATICEAFQQCSNNGESPGESMKAWSSELTETIQSIDKDLLINLRNDSLRYYQNHKHFHVGRKWDRESISDLKVVAQSLFMQRFFQLKILHIVLKDNMEVFNNLYPHLVKDANNVIKQAYGSKVFN